MLEAEKTKFPTVLKVYKYEIERIARRMGLEVPEIIYEVVDFDEMAELAARAGFPARERHWRWGQNSIIEKQRFRNALGRTFEIVINTRPVYGFLLDSNEIHDQKAVMAHVCGHAHLFERSAYAQTVNHDADQAFADDAVLFDRFCEEFGADRVKQWFDQALSLENLFDPEAVFFKRPALTITPEQREAMRRRRKSIHHLQPREELPPYMDEFLNPPEWIEAQKERLEREETREREVERGTRVPPAPMRDVLLFLIQHAPLEGWERSLLEMVRRRLKYFSQYRTKFIHEGFASLVEEEILFELGASQDKDLVRWTSTLARVQHSRALNPYKLLYDILKDIEYRWNTGRHGPIWEECDSVQVKARWDEFVVFHNLLARGVPEQALWAEWGEFSAFCRALMAGRLGFPAELFARDAFTGELLLPAWVRYREAESEYAMWSERLQRLRASGLDEQTAAEVAKLSGGALTDEEVAFKARRDACYAAGERDLYLWTEQEIRREMASLERMTEFRREYAEGLHRVPLIDVPAEWREHSARFGSAVELGVGRRKMFEAAETCDDYNILDEFFTKDFCEKKGFYLAKAKTVWADYRTPEKHYVIETREFERIKRRLLFQFVNSHQPVIYVVNGNHNHSGELYLRHEHAGVDLDASTSGGMYVRDVMQRLFRIWGRKKRVHLETVVTTREEEKPWWFHWHAEEEKREEAPRMLRGRRTLYTYGLDDHGAEQFSMRDLGEVQFPEPF